MKRNIYDDLILWNSNENKLPLMLLGSRQVGKTYILTEFCKNEYKNFLYLNLLVRRDIVKLYETDENSDDKFIKLKMFLNNDLESEDTILFIDEIQESESLISDLKYINENFPHINIVCAGSLLGVKLKRAKFSFPVGRVSILTMYPMNFEEFLIATDNQLLISEMRRSYNDNTAMNDILHSKAIKHYNEYLCLGGMPGVINNYLSAERDFSKIDLGLMGSIIESYFDDMEKYILMNSESLKIRKLYTSIANQVGSSSKKFLFSKIDKNAKRRDFESSIDWLLASNLVLESNLVNNPVIPLKAFLETGIFKMFLSDVGILNSLLDIKLIDILEDNLSLYKGALTENFVATELTCKNHKLHYYSKNDELKVDFLLYTKDGIIPVEVKAGVNTKSKSLDKYLDIHNPKYAIRISLKNFGMNNNIKSIPLYATFLIENK